MPGTNPLEKIKTLQINAHLSADQLVPLFTDILDWVRQCELAARKAKLFAPANTTKTSLAEINLDAQEFATALNDALQALGNDISPADIKTFFQIFDQTLGKETWIGKFSTFTDALAALHTKGDHTANQAFQRTTLVQWSNEVKKHHGAIKQALTGLTQPLAEESTLIDAKANISQQIINLEYHARKFADNSTERQAVIALKESTLRMTNTYHRAGDFSSAATQQYTQGCRQAIIAAHEPLKNHREVKGTLANLLIFITVFGAVAMGIRRAWTAGATNQDWRLVRTKSAEKLDQVREAAQAFVEAARDHSRRRPRMG